MLRLTAFALLTLGLQADPVEQPIQPYVKPVNLADGFTLDHLFAVPSQMGSWIALTTLGDGRIAAADQYGALYAITIHDEEKVSVSPLTIDLTGAHGLLWHRDALYLAINERVRHDTGVYRATDQDKDGTFETIELLKPVPPSGEHGIHSLVPSPDGEWIHLIAGNMTPMPEMDHSHVPKLWAEDQLLPRNPDGRGHATQIKAPAGFVARFKPDGSQWELLSIGYRNPFDAAFNEDGELFVYDADMEWDMGTPWYRPTRLCWSLPGADFGWRNGTGKWPSYYEDSMPPVCEFGPGSPTGVVSGRGLAFPANYQKSIFCFDWTFATIYTINPKPSSDGYTGEWTEFFSATGFPLTDAIVHNGHLYFATGGRKGSSSLWRIRYTGKENTANAWKPRPSTTPPAGSRAARYIQRTAAEQAGPSEARKMLDAATHSQKLNGVIALARLRATSERKACLDTLLATEWPSLTKEEQLIWLRAASLFFIRLGEPNQEEKQAFIAKTNSAFPNEDTNLDAELCRLLCYLQAPGIVKRTLAQFTEPAHEQHTANWIRLVERNQAYGKHVAAVLRELASPRDMHYAYCLRVVKGPWSEAQRRQLFEWYALVIDDKSQESARLGLIRMRKDTLENATPEERKLSESWGIVEQPNPLTDLPKAQGPGRNWTIEDVTRLSADLTQADRENGERMYRACLCASCHRFAASGGSAGPDLTNLAGRFSPNDLATAIIDPNRVISDQYEFKIFTRHDGSTLLGKIVGEKDEVLIIASNPFDFSQTTELPQSDLLKTAPSPISPMPAALINQLNEQELRDLLAYLLKK